MVMFFVKKFDLTITNNRSLESMNIKSQNLSIFKSSNLRIFESSNHQTIKPIQTISNNFKLFKHSIFQSQHNVLSLQFIF